MAFSQTREPQVLTADKYRVLFDTSSDAHFIFAEGGILDCNEATIRLLKCRSKEDVLSIHPAVLSPLYQPDGELSSEKSKRMDEIARRDGWHRFDWVHKKADGEEFPVEVTVNAAEIDGKPVLIAVWHDLTERKRAEAELETYARTLASKNDALASVNARMKNELEAAAAVQRALLPEGLPETPGVNIEWFYRPSEELGGDILNVFRIDERRLGLYVLDVTGHGVPSALLSVTASHFLTSFVDGHAGAEDARTCMACPETMIKNLNRHFAKNGNPSHFFTLVYGVLDTVEKRFVYVSAGHPAPILVRKSGTSELLADGGLPIGLAEDAEYPMRTVDLQAGDRLYLYSDGIYEPRKTDGEEYGFERLTHYLDAMRALPLKDSLTRLVREVEHWAHPDRLHDDVSLLGLEITA